MKILVESFRDFMLSAEMHQAPGAWEIYSANPKGNDREMVEGIIEIIVKVKDSKNRESIATDMVRKLKREGVEIEPESFLKACKVKVNNHHRLQRKSR